LTQTSPEDQSLEIEELIKRILFYSKKFAVSRDTPASHKCNLEGLLRNRLGLVEEQINYVERKLLLLGNKAVEYLNEENIQHIIAESIVAHPWESGL